MNHETPDEPVRIHDANLIICTRGHIPHAYFCRWRPSSRWKDDDLPRVGPVAVVVVRRVVIVVVSEIFEFLPMSISELWVHDEGRAGRVLVLALQPAV